MELTATFKFFQQNIFFDQKIQSAHDIQAILQIRKLAAPCCLGASTGCANYSKVASLSTSCPHLANSRHFLGKLGCSFKLESTMQGWLEKLHHPNNAAARSTLGSLSLTASYCFWGCLVVSHCYWLILTVSRCLPQFPNLHCSTQQGLEQPHGKSWIA